MADQQQNANVDGWGFFDPPPSAGDPVPDEIDIILRRTFSTDEGQRALAWLRQVTIEVPAWVPGQDASYGFAREGQNSLVREIERRIKRGTK